MTDKILASKIRKFQGCAYRLVDAAFAIQKHAGGTPAHRKAYAKYDAADKAFDEADKALTDALLKENQ